MAAKIGRNDPCWCGCGKKYKACHMAFDEKLAKYQTAGHIVPKREIIKTPEQIAGIKESCKINIAVLDYIEACFDVLHTTGRAYIIEDIDIFINARKKNI